MTKERPVFVPWLGRRVTEAEWLACDDPLVRLCIVEPWVTDGGISDRKLRLFVSACSRRVWHLFTDDTRRHTVELGERFADGDVTEEEITARRAATRPGGAKQDRPEELAIARCCLLQGWLTGDGGPYYYLADILKVLREPTRKSPGAGVGAAEAALLADVVGNPFRRVTLDRSRLTPTAVSLAEAAYAERSLPSGELDPARLRVLSDALEEAGYTDAELLSHLRSPGPHVRGCWPLDLILGKE